MGLSREGRLSDEASSLVMMSAYPDGDRARLTLEGNRRGRVAFASPLAGEFGTPQATIVVMKSLTPHDPPTRTVNGVLQPTPDPPPPDSTADIVAIDAIRPGEQVQGRSGREWETQTRELLPHQTDGTMFTSIGAAQYLPRVVVSLVRPDGRHAIATLDQDRPGEMIVELVGPEGVTVDDVAMSRDGRYVAFTSDLRHGGQPRDVGAFVVGPE